MTTVFLLPLIFEAVVEVGSVIKSRAEGEAVFIEMMIESLVFVREIGAVLPKAKLIV